MPGLQQLQFARRELTLESAMNRLDRFDVLIPDGSVHITKDRAESSVPLELIIARYERRSMMITADRPFSASNTVFRIQR